MSAPRIPLLNAIKKSLLGFCFVLFSNHVVSFVLLTFIVSFFPSKTARFCFGQKLSIGKNATRNEKATRNLFGIDQIYNLDETLTLHIPAKVVSLRLL